MITERVRAIAEKAVGDDIELVHVEMSGTNRDSVVRIYIDKEGGVTVGDCTAVSQRVEEVLDAEDTIPARYVLEVSSPGIERELYSLKDFEKFAGQLAKVKLVDEIDGQKVFVGPITSIDGSKITIDDRTKGAVNFDHSAVKKANLKIDLAKEFGR